MDKNYFEFWGQSFLNIAKGQRQMEDFNRWLRLWGDGADSMSVLFRRIYGLDKLDKADKEEKYDETYLRVYERAMQSLQDSMKECLRIFDVAPREEFEAVVKERDDLKLKISEQEQTIAQLKTALEGRGKESVQAVSDLQGLIKKQTDQFQELLQAMSKTFEKQRAPKVK